jgi:hypothetical protein
LESQKKKFFSEERENNKNIPKKMVMNIPKLMTPVV